MLIGVELSSVMYNILHLSLPPPLPPSPSPSLHLSLPPIHTFPSFAVMYTAGCSTNFIWNQYTLKLAFTKVYLQYWYHYIILCMDGWLAWLLILYGSFLCCTTPLSFFQHPDIRHEDHPQLFHQLNCSDDEWEGWMVLVFQVGPIIRHVINASKYVMLKLTLISFSRTLAAHWSILLWVLNCPVLLAGQYRCIGPHVHVQCTWTWFVSTC